MTSHDRRARLEAFLERQPKWAIALVATTVHGVLYLRFRTPQPLTYVETYLP